jgi:hypothetical protein
MYLNSQLGSLIMIVSEGSPSKKISTSKRTSHALDRPMNDTIRMHNSLERQRNGHREIYFFSALFTYSFVSMMLCAFLWSSNFELDCHMEIWWYDPARTTTSQVRISRYWRNPQNTGKPQHQQCLDTFSSPSYL